MSDPPSHPPPHPPVIEYAVTASPPAPPPPPPWLRACRIGASLLAALSIPLPFAWGVSPFQVYWNGDRFTDIELLLLALPFLAGLPAAIWAVLTIAWPGRARRGRVAAYVVAGVALVATLWSVGRIGVDQPPVDVRSMSAIAAALTALALGVLLTIHLARRRLTEDAGTAALTTAYAANAALCLVGFFPSTDPGWWVTLLAVLGMATDGTMTFIRTRRRP